MTLPNFLIVGAAKSGTTSLYHYLNQHPEVFLPANKEPHHFAPAKWCGHPPLDRASYEKLFEGTANYTVRGEASTGYLYYPDSPDMIHKGIPDCRIVIILREPVARAYSGYCHELREGLETVSFEEALAEERRGTRIIRGGEFSFNYIKQSIVCHLIKRYIALFGQDRVHICLYDDLVENPAELMHQLFRFLGVDDTFDGNWGYRYNPSGLPRMQALHNLLDGENIISYRLRQFVASRGPDSRWQSLWHRLRDWNISSRHDMFIEGETERFLRQRFEPEIRCLETLLERDLSHWRNPVA